MFIRLFLASIAALMVFATSAAGAPAPYNADTTFLFEYGHGHCSATAVGPHTILTAEHCLTGDVRAVQLDGGKALDVVSITPDGADHVLIRLDHTFTEWAKLGVAPKLAQPIYIRGNPEFLRDQLRFGRVSGSGKLPEGDLGKDPPPVLLMTFTFYDVGGAGGDSGAAIFDLSGRIVGMVSIKTAPASGSLNLLGSLPLQFSRSQWAQAAK